MSKGTFKAKALFPFMGTRRSRTFSLYTFGNGGRFRGSNEPLRERRACHQTLQETNMFMQCFVLLLTAVGPAKVCMVVTKQQ